MNYKTMKRTLTTCILCCILMTATAQTYTGKVVKADGTAMESATVILQNEKGTTLKFSKTNKQGQFSITTPEGKKAARLTFVSVGFNKKTVSLNDYKNGQSTAMEERTEELKEVEVKPEKFWVKGDTMVYSVTGYREKQDRSIEDVIKRLPGIEVSQNGEIAYNGKKINKFYVEGQDLTDGKYAQITKNLSADKVKNVEVLRNHQPVKMLRGKKFSDQAAINLTLNDDAKGRITGTADLTTGLSLQKTVEWLRNSRLVAMMFGKNMQTLNMYKCNNTGEDVSMEIISHYFSFNDERSILHNINAGRAPVSDQRRTRFNDCHLVASNWLVKTGKESNMRIQLSGLYDREKGEQYHIAQYGDVSTPTVIEETSTSETYRREWNAGVYYTVNSSKIRVENRVVGNLNYNESSGSTSLNGRHISQHVTPRKRSIGDALMINKNLFKNDILSLNSIFDYNYLPGTLTLHYGNEENLNVHALNWASTMELTHHFGKFSIGGVAAFELHNKHEDVAYADTLSGIVFHHSLLRLSPKFAYSRLSGLKSLSISFQPRMTRHHRTMGNEQEDRWVCEPMANITYTPLMQVSFNAHYSYTYSPNDFYSVSPLRVYTSYNLASSGTGIFDHGSGHTANASLIYRDLKGAGNAMLLYNFSRTKSGQLYSSRLSDGVYVREAVGGRNITENNSIRLSGSKPLHWLGSKINLACGYSWNETGLLLSGKPIQSKGESFNVSETFSVHPTLQVTITQTTTYNNYRSKNTTLSHRSIQTFNHHLDFIFMPGKWQMEWKNECYHSNDKDMKFSFFSDLSVSFRTKAYELGVFCYNLLGRNRYEHRFVTAESMNYYIYRLRPRELMLKLCLSM